MDQWEEIFDYYKRQGAPGDQQALVSMFKEIQQIDGCVRQSAVTEAARFFGVKESFLLAVIRRVPSLRLGNAHCLELCCGANCRRTGALRMFIEKTYGTMPKQFEIRYTECMRLCGQGPNLKWDGKIYHRADEALVRRLIQEIDK